MSIQSPLVTSICRVLLIFYDVEPYEERYQSSRYKLCRMIRSIAAERNRWSVSSEICRISRDLSSSRNSLNSIEVSMGGARKNCERSENIFEGTSMWKLVCERNRRSECDAIEEVR